MGSGKFHNVLNGYCPSTRGSLRVRSMSKSKAQEKTTLHDAGRAPRLLRRAKKERGTSPKDAMRRRSTRAGIEIPRSDFELIGEGGLDERNRLSLTKVLAKLRQRLAEPASIESLHFRIYVNAAGQILLDPALTVPIREMWLYRNPVALAKVREGLAQAAEGDFHDLGSFSRFADDEIE